MKTFKLVPIRDFHDIEINERRRKGEMFTTDNEERVYQLLNKEEKDRVVEIYEIRHD